MKKFALMLVCLSMLWVTGCSSKPRLTDEEKATLELKPAVALVMVGVKVAAFYKGQQINLPDPYLIDLGSGFLFRPDGYLITNGHVVANAMLNNHQAREQLEASLKRKVYIEVFKQINASRQAKGTPLLTAQDMQQIYEQNLFEIRYGDPALNVFLANRQHFPGDILQYSPEVGEGKDVAIIKIGGNNLPTVPLGNSDQVKVQDATIAIGYPGVASDWGGNPIVSEDSAYVPTVTDGHISAIKTMGKTGTPVLQSDVAITHGNSGGPAFNDEGQVIGITTFGSPSNSGEGETAGFNFFVPINTAMEFVRQTGVTPEAGGFDEHWGKALDLYSQGRCHASLAEFDDVLQFMPGLPDAQQYRAAAVACYDTENPVERIMDDSRWVIYLIGGIVILGLGVLVMRRRTAIAGAPARVGTTVVTRTEVAQPAVLPASPKAYGSIQATSGALSGKTFKITKDGLLIGRSPKCQVVLPDETVSGEHAWIVPVDHGVVVIDKGSSNGTYVNSTDSARISKIGLQNGDRIYIGKKGANVFTYFSS
jgi:serine protease Do